MSHESLKVTGGVDSAVRVNNLFSFLKAKSFNYVAKHLEKITVVSFFASSKFSVFVRFSKVFSSFC